MSFVKRAVLYLKRKKSRSLLLLAIIFAASSFILSGLALRTGALTETKNVEKTLGSSFILKINSNDPENKELVTTDTYSFEAYTGKYISKDMVHEINSIDGVTNYMINTHTAVWTNLELRPGLWADSYNNPSPSYPSLEEVHIRTQETLILPCTSSELHENFRTGAFSLIEGNAIKENDHHTAMISNRLAKRNNVKIGDTLKIEIKEGMYQSSDTPAKTWGEPVELNIVGIFSVNFEQEPSLYTPESEYAENLIYTDWDTGVQMKSYIKSGAIMEEYGEVTFFVNDPTEMNTIINQVKAMEEFNEKYFVIEQDDTAYRSTAKALNQLNILATILILAGTVGCIAILVLVLNMWTKNRKKEIGILLSTGTSKREVILQLGLECMMVTIVALILTIALSGRLTGTLCSFAEDMAFPDSQGNEYVIEVPEGSLMPTFNKTSAIEVHMDYTVSLQTIGIIIITTCLVSIVSVVAAAMQITKMNPRDLLQSL
ncbi:MAG: ABC transporter permease [Blautia sp.]|jgi:putative ABC transport system permease protein